MKKVAHILKSQQFDRETISEIFKKADRINKSKSLPLRGKILASLFYEPSTRTRFSFESAMLRLGGAIISTENAREFSSAAKGESLEDSIRVINNYADVIILRHFEEGASEKAAAVSRIPIVNAGDGAGQHPTQALLDLYTIYKELGSINGIHVAFVGDLKNGRTARSLAFLLGKYKHVTLTFIAPKELQIGSDITEYLTKKKITYNTLTSWDKVLPTIDVLYMTRIQKERFRKQHEYKKYRDSYQLTLSHVVRMKKRSIIMHPLPRLKEIATEVDESEKAVYFKQTKYGLYIRMAILITLFGK